MSAWFSTFSNLAPNVSLTPNADGNYDFDTINFTHIHNAIAGVCNQPWGQIPNPDKFRPGNIRIEIFKSLIDL